MKTVYLVIEYPDTQDYFEIAGVFSTFEKAMEHCKSRDIPADIITTELDEVIDIDVNKLMLTDYSTDKETK